MAQPLSLGDFRKNYTPINFDQTSTLTGWNTSSFRPRERIPKHTEIQTISIDCFETTFLDRLKFGPNYSLAHRGKLKHKRQTCQQARKKFAHYKTTCVHKRRQNWVGADIMLYGADTTQLGEGNDRQIDRSWTNVDEVRKVVPKQAIEISGNSFFRC